MKSYLCQQGDLHLPPNASKLLTNHVKAFPQSCFAQVSQSVYMKKCCLNPLGSPYLTNKVTLPSGWPYTTRDKCEICLEICQGLN